LENLKIEMNNMKIDILGVLEMRCPNLGDWCSGNNIITQTGASGKKLFTRGIGIIANKVLGNKYKGCI